VSAWTNLSKLQEWKLGGVSKSFIGVNGTYCQIKPAAVTTVGGVTSTVTLLTLATNRRYKFTVIAVGKEGGNGDDVEIEQTASFYRYTTGGAVQRGTSKSSYFYAPANTTAEFGVSGNDVIFNLNTPVAQTIQLYVTYEINTA
jgi:hypothetical protein